MSSGFPRSPPPRLTARAIGLTGLGLATALGLGLISELLADLQPLRRARPALCLISAGLATVWILAIAAVRVTRDPPNPEPGPATDLLGDEPPAVVSLLVNNFDLTRHAIPATVLDLAARHVLAIDHVGPGHDVIRMGAAPAGLRLYEAGVMGILQARSRDGVVPVGALGVGSREYARGWWRSFRGAVIADAQAGGLSRDLWDTRTLWILAAVGLLPAPFLALAGGDFWLGVFPVIVVAAVIGALRATRRQRETPAGVTAASRWLGVRRNLEQAASIEDVPPSGVVVWERRLAYATAMGLARETLRAMPMGADDERRAWSSYGGAWRPVLIRYPRWWPPGWGWPPWAAVIVGVVAALLGIGALRVAAGIGWVEADPLFPAIVIALRAFVIVALVLGLAFGLWGLASLFRGLLDLGPSRSLTGQVLRVRKRGDEDPRHYVAIDDGTSDVVRALRVTSGALNHADLREYGEATAHVTRYLRHVRSIGSVS
jgi:predicted membrane protein DUF2207